jgi:Helix-turn-helix domain/NUMOD3 motif
MSERTCTIYGLYDPRTDELRYVGKTMQAIEVRLRAHLKPSTVLAKTHLYNWIRSLLNQGLRPLIKPIEVVPCERQDEAECWWIAYHREQGADLVNYTEGGTGGATRTGRSITAEHKARLLEGLARARAEGKIKPRKLTDKERRSLSQKRKGMKFTDEHRASISRARKGKPLSEEHRRHIGVAHRGRLISEEHRQHISEGKKGKYTPAMQEQIQRLRERRAANPEILRPNTRLTPDQVREIKQMLSEGKSLNSLAKQFGVDKRTIQFIKQGKTWRDV